MLVPSHIIGHHDGSRPDTAEDKEKLDQGKKALKKLLQKNRAAKSKRLGICAAIRLYGTLLAGTMAVVTLGLFCFLVPMRIDPALATLTFQFTPERVVIYVQQVRMIYGLSNVTWCSCTEGCTKDIYICYQIIVSYHRLPKGMYIDRNLLKNSKKTRKRRSTKSIKSTDNIANSTNLNYITIGGKNYTYPLEKYIWYDEKLGIPSRIDSQTGAVTYDAFKDNCEVCEAKLLVNIKGCGYPPDVNCTNFKNTYAKPGMYFVGHYSNEDPTLVLAKYDVNEIYDELWLLVGGSFGLMFLGGMIIAILHLPYRTICKRWIADKQ